MHHFPPSLAERTAFEPRSSLPALGENRHRPLSFRKQRIPGEGGLFFKFL